MSDGNNWRDMIAAERMRVDQGFDDQLEVSPLSRQQWGLVMTAVEFDIENPENPDEAKLIANTSKLPSVMSEIEKMGDRSSAMGGVPSQSGSSSSGGGLLGSVKDALGIGGGKSELQETAERLSQEYASNLQAHLEKRGRWELICKQATGGQQD